MNIKVAWVFACRSLSPPQMPLQKLLFSATLTQNPEKLQELGLHQPRLFSATHGSGGDEKFNFPQGLTVRISQLSAPHTHTHTYKHVNILVWLCFLQEYYVSCTLSKKPLLILHFLLRLKYNPVLCFTNSREAAHR